MLRRPRLGATAAVAALLCAAPGAAHAQSSPGCAGWMDPSKPAEQRARALLGAMTLDEKIRVTYGSLSSSGFASEVPANDRLCMPAFVQSDGPAGVAGGFGGTQQGVTAFPVGMAQASTWDPALQRRLGAAMAEEALGKGANVLLAPATNINRVPQNGRNFEYFGEDPFLSARTSVAEVDGIQSQPVVATIKHYALNNQETDRMTVSAEADERTKREIYFPAFEAAVEEGHAGSAMCAYNKVGGTYACENDTLLNKVLKDEWGFDGWVMSDWTATHSTEKAANAGLDQEQNGYGAQFFGDKLKAAVQSGGVPQARLDDMVLRVLRPAFRLGLFEHRPAAQPGAYAANVSTDAHRQVALDVAEQGSVLLKNDGGILPLDTIKPGTRIAVIGRSAGPNATNAAVGTGSAHVLGPASDPLTQIGQRAAARGAIVTYTDGTATEDAAAAARAADVALVFVRDHGGEGSDRPSDNLGDGACVALVCMTLPTDQDQTVNAVADANPNTVVVMLTSGPVVMPWLGKVKGLLEMWYPGARYGDAAARLLFGEANPSGRLTQTFPRKAADLPFRSPEQYPGTNGKVVYAEGLKVGYRWFDAQGIEPQFPFGYGLSYTTFGVGDLTIRPAAGVTGATVRMDVRNTGARAGAEVAQLYVGFPSSTGEPPRQLKGFAKVALQPGARQTVSLGLDRRSFATWDTAARGWRVDAGCYRIMAGRSSRDITDQAVVALGHATCPGAVARIALPAMTTGSRRCVSRRRVTLHLRDPKGRERLVSATVRVAGRRVAMLRGGRLRTALRRGVAVSFAGRTGTVRVTVAQRTSRGRTITRGQTFRLCVRRH